MVKIFIVLVPLALAFNISAKRDESVSSKHCYSYKCDNLNKVPEGDCVAYENNVFHLQPCEEGLTCPVPIGPTFEIVKCVETQESTEKAYVEEPCSSNEGCLSGTCSALTSTCEGLKKDEECLDNFECAAGLYCYQGKCASLIPAGSTGCTNLFECESDSVCHFTNSFSGKCEKMFSLKNGSEVSDCILGESYLCSSGSCASSGSSDVCVAAFKSTSRTPNRCTSNKDCLGESGDHLLQSYCSCGYNANGNAYCEALMGDRPGQTFLKYMKQFYGSSFASKCNTMRRFNTECFEISEFKDKEEMVNAALYYRSYPYYQDNNSCVRQIYTAEYWSQAASLVLALLAFNLV